MTRHNPIILHIRQEFNNFSHIRRRRGQRGKINTYMHAVYVQPIEWCMWVCTLVQIVVSVRLGINDVWTHNEEGQYKNEKCSCTFRLTDVSIKPLRTGLIKMLIPPAFIYFYHMQYYIQNLLTNNNTVNYTQTIKMFMLVKFSSPTRWLLQDWFVVTQYCSRWITARQWRSHLVGDENLTSMSILIVWV